MASERRQCDANPAFRVAWANYRLGWFAVLRGATFDTSHDASNR
jgi:hypothetical protein